MDLAIACITQKYADFSGRAQRSEFWLFVLLAFIASIIASVLDMMLGLFSDEVGLGVLSGILSLGLLVPGFAVGARRLHDINKSGWWQLLYLIPLIGAIALIVMWILPGTDGANDHGQDPLQS